MEQYSSWQSLYIMVSNLLKLSESLKVSNDVVYTTYILLCFKQQLEGINNLFKNIEYGIYNTPITYNIVNYNPSSITSDSSKQQILLECEIPSKKVNYRDIYRYLQNAYFEEYWTDFTDFINKSKNIINDTKGYTIDNCKYILQSIIKSSESKKQKKGMLIWFYYELKKKKSNINISDQDFNKLTNIILFKISKYDY